MAPIAIVDDYGQAVRLVEELSARDIGTMTALKVQIPGVFVFADPAHQELWWIAADGPAWSVESKNLGQVVEAMARRWRTGAVPQDSHWLELCRRLAAASQPTPRAEPQAA
ncbi:hypothetical protein ACIBUY_03940 [Streptomyces sp. NPDC050085]|uniref:hypothetical protein n=1 Tax=Streptomyces sp. NPDC050085 TaxID=3365600 RepID=UPI003794EAE5